MNRTYSHPSPTPRDVRDPQNPFYQGVHQGKHWYLWHPDDMGGAKPMNELFWFEAFQPLLLKVVNSGYGRQLMGIDIEIPEIVLITKNAIHYRLGANEYQAQFYVGAKFANVIRYRWPEFKRYARFFYDMPQFFTLLNMNGVAVPAHATSTHYPDPHTETSTVDGVTKRQDLNETWSQIHDGTGSEVADSSAEDGISISAHSSSNQWAALKRGVFLFDTSALSGATVTAAVYSSYGGAIDSSITSSVSVCTSNPASNTALVSSDHLPARYGTTAFSTIAIGSLGVGSYNDFTLDANGRAAVSTSGITKLGTRFSNDIADSPPTWVESSQVYYQTFFADETGTSKDPKLFVTYSTSNIEKINGIAIASIQAFNGITAANGETINGITF